MLHMVDLTSLALIALAGSVWLWGLIDCARTPRDRVRFLPKLLWLLILLNGSVLATLAWVYFGRKPAADAAKVPAGRVGSLAQAR